MEERSPNLQKEFVGLTYRATIDQDNGLDLGGNIASKVLQYLREICDWSYHICNIVDAQ